jgi:outer membrane protein TolC
VRVRAGLVASLLTGLVSGLVSGLISGCTTPEEYASDADLEVGVLLAETSDRSLAGREEWVLRPEPAAEPPPPSAEAAAGDSGTALEQVTDGAAEATGEPPLLLDLPTALEIAVQSGREFLNQKESIYLQGLGLTLTRYNFGPLLNATVAYLWSDSKNSAAGSTLGWNMGVTQILPTGGDFAINGGLVTSHFGGSADADNDPLHASTLNFNLSQPLLRGAGYEVSHEALTQAERSIVYATRDFELFREDFTIGIARDFFDLVSQKQRLANLEQNWKDAQFDQTKAEALRQVDRNRDEDVFLARRRVINAETDLLSARTSYEASVDEFKLRLGLSTSDPVIIADAEPPFEPVRLDPDSAVAVALHNRLDLITADEQLEDSERSLRIARNGLLPDLTLGAGYGLGGDDDQLLDAVPDSPSSSFSLALQLPLNRQGERNAYRSALIALDRARRDYTLLLDNTERDILDQLRQLERVEQQIDLQTQQIEQEQRAVAVTEIRYEAGDVDNRDLLDARQSLVDAQNALIDLKVDHFIARLSLLRDLGLLFIDDKGMWTS